MLSYCCNIFITCDLTYLLSVCLYVYTHFYLYYIKGITVVSNIALLFKYDCWKVFLPFRKMFWISFCLFLVYPICLLAQQTCFQNFYWRDFIPGTIPYDALHVQNSRYIGQVQINRNNVPGTIIPHGSNSFVAEFGGRQIHKVNIQILCSPELQRFYWEKVDFAKPYDEQMKNSVKGGFQVDLDYYIGAALDNGEVKIGRVIPIEYDGKRGLYVWHPNGQVKMLQQFFLLKYNPT
ncbi:hypothetical protein AMK59_2864, partial [Oryctes borbonicus]